jgi:curved DNA-binding protein CbpA
MKHHFETLGLQEGASQQAIQEAYDRLSRELNPSNNDNQEFFIEEYEKVQEAYKALNQSSILKNSDSSGSSLSSKKLEDSSSSSKNAGSFTVTISPEKIEELKNKAHIVNDKPPKSFSWWKFDDEYITGWQYFRRSLIGFLLSIIIVGFYLQAVTAYKRSKSLENSESSCTFFGIWGGLSPIIGLTPAAIINIIPHWYLWFSNGRNPNRRN